MLPSSVRQGDGVRDWLMAHVWIMMLLAEIARLRRWNDVLISAGGRTSESEYHRLRPISPQRDGTARPELHAAVFWCFGTKKNAGGPGSVFETWTLHRPDLAASSLKIPRAIAEHQWGQVLSSQLRCVLLDIFAAYPPHDAWHPLALSFRLAQGIRLTDYLISGRG